MFEGDKMEDFLGLLLRTKREIKQKITWQQQCRRMISMKSNFEAKFANVRSTFDGEKNSERKPLGI